MKPNEKKLAEALEKSRRHQAEVEALLEGTRAVLTLGSFPETARKIFDFCKQVTGATAGYVALLTPDGEENEVLFLDDGGMPCTVPENLPMPIRGLRADAYRSLRPVYENDFLNSQWTQFLPEGHVEMRNVLFAPLVIEDTAVGLLGLANKKENFNDNDAKLAMAFGELASIALRNSRNLDLLKESQRAAEAANQTKSRFLSTMSHEIRTPLTPVIGCAELLLDSPLDQEQAKLANIILKRGEDLLQLLNDLLDLSRIEANQMNLDLAEFSVRELVEDVTSSVFTRAKEKNLRAFHMIASDLPDRVICDPLRLRQILMNLLSNAVKFTQEGEISLRVAEHADQRGASGGYIHVEFTVADTGIGIPPGKVERIFDPFTQADGSTTRRFGGTGLGLAIVKHLVEALGGRVDVESVPSEGSTFRFHIPVKPAAAAAKTTEGRTHAARTSDEDQARSTPANARVLLVEDDPHNQHYVRGVLENDGFQVSVAENGAAAARICRGQETFDLVLLDLKLPDIDGLHLLKELRTKAGLSDKVPVIALTACAMKEDRERVEKAGVKSHLTKPIRKRDLLNAVKRFLDHANPTPPTNSEGELP